MRKDYDSRIDWSEPDDAHVKQIEMVGPGKKVVDFGCWNGLVAGALKERGCHVTGIEMDPEAAQAAREACDRVIVADLDQIDLDSALEGEEYEVGLFGDVIEHLKNPRRLLTRMRGLLAPGGYLVVSVPNIAHASIRLMLLGGRFDYEDKGILDDSHLKYFTRESIGDLLESCGYIVEVMDCVEKRIPARVIREALDPLGLGNLEEVIKSFSTWEAVAYQYVVKAFPASEEAQVQRLSEEKVQAERRLREVEGRLADHDRILDDIEKKDLDIEKKEIELEKAGEYAKSLEGLINDKDTYIKSLEAESAELRRALDERARRIEELERGIAELKARSGGTRGRKRA